MKQEIKLLNYNNNYITIITKFDNNVGRKMSKAIWGTNENDKQTFIKGTPEQLTDDIIKKAFEAYYNNPHRIGILYISKEDEYPSFLEEKHIGLEFKNKDPLGLFELDKDSEGDFCICCYDTRQPKQSIQFLNQLYHSYSIPKVIIKSLKKNFKETLKKCKTKNSL